MNRAYKSTLREDQAKATRQRIVDALIEQASQTGRSDFSIAEVAARAGVAERTVYRYFPTREALLDAVGGAIEAGARAVEPEGPEDVAASVRALYAWFEENEALVEASHVTGVGSEVRARGRRVRGERARKMIDAWASALTDAERRRAFAVFRTMFGSFTWRTMRRELGMSAEETIDAVEWVVGLVMADLARRERAAARAKEAKKGGDGARSRHTGARRGGAR